MLAISKTIAATQTWRPFEEGEIAVDPGIGRVEVADGAGRVYVDVQPVRGSVRMAARGCAGIHRVRALRTDGSVAAETAFRLTPRTGIACDHGPYAQLSRRIDDLLTTNPGREALMVGGRVHELFMCWLRDHTHVLKAMRHLAADVTSGIELFLGQQSPDGMLWDDIHRNRSGAPAWFGEALGVRYHGYLDGHRWILRRIPVEADVEYLAVEAVHHAWKANGDDGWMRAQLPHLELAIAYTTGSPLRWSRRHGLVKRAYTMDSWDFKHPDPTIGGGGDHRCLAARKQPFFLFHGDNSGLYAAHRRLAEMHRALGDRRAAVTHERRAAALRERANRVLWRDPIYAHHVPELPMPGLREQIGNDDRRISLSLPYTINRGLPDHAMAVRAIDEYRRRGRAQRHSSFAEWWTMDPLYADGQWGDGNPAHQTPGEYMNGGVSPLVAGELARAAFEHGREAYGADILRRLWALSEVDGGELHDTYRRLPPGFVEPALEQRQRTLDLRPFATVGLRHHATPGVTAWTGESDNDLRHLPIGRQRWQAVDVEIIDPAANGGRSVVALGGAHPAHVDISWDGELGCFYAIHALGGSGAGTVGSYDLVYADGGAHSFPLIAGRELANWWNPQPLTPLQTVAFSRSCANIGRICWRGPNPRVLDVGLYLSGFTNPHPSRRVSAIRLSAAPSVALMVVALTTGDGPARFPQGIRSFGLPAAWPQAAVHHALVEGLGGVEDADRAFGTTVRISPRWSATEVTSAEVCVHYPASDGYCAYRWRHEPRHRRLVMDITGSFRCTRLRVLLPPGVAPRTATIDGVAVPVTAERIESSTYAVIDFASPPPAPVIIRYHGGRAGTRSNKTSNASP